jgi:putative glutamine amidotransferase
VSRKPLIGVVPLWDDDKESLWILPGYFDGIQQAGGLPLMLPLTDDQHETAQLASLCDGFLFTGGHDVSPSVYGETPLNDSVICCPKRDRMESLLLQEAVLLDKPVLGICRGIQFINAAFGGTLYQDLPVQHPSEVEHHQTAPYNTAVHAVIIRKETPLYDLLHQARIAVNSYHHQAVHSVAPGLEIMAESPDGIVEALYHPGLKFLWAVQWHPEFSFRTDENSRQIFRAFVQATLGVPSVT